MGEVNINLRASFDVQVTDTESGNERSILSDVEFSVPFEAAAQATRRGGDAAVLDVFCHAAREAAAEDRTVQHVARREGWYARSRFSGPQNLTIDLPGPEGVSLRCPRPPGEDV